MVDNDIYSDFANNLWKGNLIQDINKTMYLFNSPDIGK